MYTKPDVSRSVLECVTTDLAILKILFDKGICNSEEFNRARLECIPIVEQIHAELTEAFTRELEEEEYPGLKIIKKLMGGIHHTG